MLSNPRDGDSYNGKKSVIELKWQPVGALAAGETYRITIEYVHEGTPATLTVDTAETHWRVSPSLFAQADQPDRTYRWSVQVVLKQGEKVIPVSPRSQVWEFHWH